MFNRLREKINRKLIVSVLLVCFAALATIGGIKYFEFRQRQKAVQNPAYKTALGIISLERYPKLALSQEQARKLLPIVRELAEVKGVPVDGDKKAEAMKSVLKPEQLDFVATVGAVGFPRGWAWSAGVKGLSVEKGVYDRTPGYKLYREYKVRRGGKGPKGDRFPGRENRNGYRSAGVYGLLLEMLMQKVYG